MDEISTKIIIQLQRDGRTPNTAIARRLRIAEATVRKRIDRLVKEKVIWVRAWPDPLKIGYTVIVNIDVRVNPPAIESVAARLAAFPEIYFLGVCTGEFDLHASAAFRSNEHMYEFITKRLSRVPGIANTSTGIVMRVVKREPPTPVLSKSISPSSRRRKSSQNRRTSRGQSAGSHGTND